MKIARYKLNYIILIFFDFLVNIVALILSFSLRLGVSPLEVLKIESFFNGYLIFVAAGIQTVCFFFMGLYKGIWKFASTHDLVRIILAVSFAIPVTGMALFLIHRLENVPRTVFLIDWFILIVGIGGSRFLYKIFRQRSSYSKRRNKAIIIGAGEAGEQLLREFQKNVQLDTEVVAFIDDNKALKNRRIHGVRILGSIEKLPGAIVKMKATEVIVGFASPNSKQIRKIVDACGNTGVAIKKIPNLGSIIRGENKISQIRDVSYEDLLGRESVKLDNSVIKSMIKNKVILITGAGGSIGSELCRQIVAYNPSLIIMYEAVELFLYNLEMEFNKNYPSVKIKPIIGNVRDAERLRYMMKKYKPQVVFHAAAYKHVPLMEENPVEAVKNNILGTWNVALVSREFDVEKMVLVSTDKAVNPTSIMGATKRIGEIICQHMQNQNKTKYVAVRFGNVLGSAGSVIPLFKKQIEGGGPITVTHPDITRYFMSIPEACQLVMQAGAIGDGGEVFVLEMGEPVKIYDLAKEMIILSGLTLEKDIKIEITGLRPGEKLYEELLTDKEETMTTTHPGLRVAKMSKTIKNAEKLIQEIMNISHENTSVDVQAQLKKIVFEYSPYVEKNKNNLRLIKKEN
ncbi:MAG: polysaccharide biosynthesis protein [Spirochaetia bacterium]|nr:polysaccharide biosynthesis protein [Spirochaetia bacterium]